tara:strand:- start:1539 stop:2426 length:888 start_codon:yes stop_codon:yes gene_type:complete
MINKKKLFLGFVCILFSCSNQDTSKGILEISEIPPLKVYSCDSDSIIISSEAKIALMEVGMTQCMMPFGVLLSADQNMPVSYLEMSGRILAELLDQDLDGAIDDSSLFSFVSNWEVGWLAMPTDHQQWESEQLPTLNNKLGYDIIIPSWWMNSSSPEPSEHSIAIMVEEITHFLTQFGYGPRYPNEFGVENWSSIIAQETMNAQCDWWQHPENDCPNSAAQYSGNCSHPNCDVVEFYHQVLVLRAGMQPGWFGIGFPTSSDQLEELLSGEIKELMDDPTYHQLNAPLTFNYPIEQ